MVNDRWLIYANVRKRSGKTALPSPMERKVKVKTEEVVAEQPKTARAAMMLDIEGQRIERRDRAVAMSVAAEMVERFYKPEDIKDMRDVREQITRAAEFAAYTAIQRERELHQGDMSALRAWSEVKWAEHLLKPLAAQRIEARSDETVQPAQPEGREPGPKDAPKSQ